MQIRRVVTGHDSTGKAVFASDQLVDGYHPTLAPESAFHVLWGADEVRRFPDDGSEPPHPGYFPPVGGFRFGTFTLPPAGTAPPAELDDGAEVTLEAGDTVVQNGTRHAWHNRSDAPAHIAVFLVGAHHDRVG
jgi:hypothetical protein